MSAVKAFHNAFKTMKRKDWDKIYVAVDIHETILHPTWSEERSTTFYKYAQTVLQHLSTREDIVLILWTSTSPANAKIYHDSFRDNHDINFKYINCNPEVESTSYADFDSKFYVNVILDDKAGFEPEKEWLELLIMFGLSTKN